MNLQLSEKQVSSWAKEHSYALGLKGANIKAEYIWNPGGFVNQSYQISDGETFRHVKFAQAETAARLKQWTTIADHLTEHYYAPKLIHEVTDEILPRFIHGLVFEFIEGEPLNGISDAIPFIPRILQTLNRLHHDEHIKKVIGSIQKSSYAEAFTEEYITRFKADLQIISSARHLLNFVSDETIDWFYTEVETLKQLVNRHSCFQKQAVSVTHNDINWQNILIPKKNFRIIDWDDLTVTGDPAMDYSVFLWPIYHTKEWTMVKDQMTSLAGEEIMARMEIYFRAKLLDDVIDVLADYIEAENMPNVKEKTQKRAKEIHLHGIDQYKRIY